MSVINSSALLPNALFRTFAALPAHLSCAVALYIEFLPASEEAPRCFHSKDVDDSDMPQRIACVVSFIVRCSMFHTSKRYTQISAASPTRRHTATALLRAFLPTERLVAQLQERLIIDRVESEEEVHSPQEDVHYREILLMLLHCMLVEECTCGVADSAEMFHRWCRTKLKKRNVRGATSGTPLLLDPPVGVVMHNGEMVRRHWLCILSSVARYSTTALPGRDAYQWSPTRQTDILVHCVARVQLQALTSVATGAVCATELNQKLPVSSVGLDMGCSEVIVTEGLPLKPRREKQKRVPLWASGSRSRAASSSPYYSFQNRSSDPSTKLLGEISGLATILRRSSSQVGDSVADLEGDHQLIEKKVLHIYHSAAASSSPPRSISSFESLSLLDVFASVQLYQMPLYVNEVMVHWLQGNYTPLVLLHRIPTPLEVLHQQSNGDRAITLFLCEVGLSSLHVSPLAYMSGEKVHKKDALDFLVHDISHMNLFLNRDTYEEQVGFFSAMESLRPYHYFVRQCGMDEDMWSQLQYCFSDMNCWVTHLIKYLRAKWLAAEHRLLLRSMVDGSVVGQQITDCCFFATRQFISALCSISRECDR